jgi:hypothetical protein
MKNLKELEDRNKELIEELNIHLSSWFYLECHPEDLKEVIQERLYGIQHERDRYGHIKKEDR